VERVNSFRYLGVHIAEDLTWTTQINTLLRKAKQPLYHLRQLRKNLSLPEDPSDLLHWCGGEHPDRKHHCLVRQQLLSGQEGSAHGSAFSWTHYWHYTPCPAGPVLIEVSNQSLQDAHHHNNKLFQLMRSGKRLPSHAANRETKTEFLSKGHQDWTLTSPGTAAPMHTLRYSSQYMHPHSFTHFTKLTFLYCIVCVYAYFTCLAVYFAYWVIFLIPKKNKKIKSCSFCCKDCK